MRLQHLSVTGFRNLKDLNVSWSPHANILLGKNGQGKTSILEAIYFLGSGRSFRTSETKEMISFTHEAFRIEGSVAAQRGTQSMLAAQCAKRGRAKFSLHEKETNLSQGYLGKLVAVAFAPSDTEIVRGAPALRRKFMDKHVVDIYPAHLEVLQRYQRALKSKVSLLVSGSASDEMLEPWDRLLAEEGASMTAMRLRFIADLKSHISLILPLFAPQDGEASIYLQQSTMPHTDTSPSAEEYYQAIVLARPREIASQRALVGPHRDDLSLLLGNAAARDFSSQGQARTLTLLLKLAVAELVEQKTGESPIILLDDADSELDEERARFLFSVFAEKNRQLFISSTTMSNLWPEGGAVFRIETGKILK